MKTLFVKQASYISEYKIELIFSDNKSKIIDFEPFLFKNSHPQHDKYRKLTNFKTFKIENGSIVWGIDWDLTFSIDSLYKGKI